MSKTRKINGRTIQVRPPKSSNETRVCACGCGRKFVPSRSDQIYFNKACNTREQQRKLRERARIGT